MDGPRPVPTLETILDAVAWARDFMVGTMTDWPDWLLERDEAGGVEIPASRRTRASGQYPGQGRPASRPCDHGNAMAVGTG